MDDQSTDREPVSENKRPLISSDLATPIYGLFGLGILYTLYVAHQIGLAHHSRGDDEPATLASGQEGLR